MEKITFADLSDRMGNWIDRQSLILEIVSSVPDEWHEDAVVFGCDIAEAMGVVLQQAIGDEAELALFDLDLICEELLDEHVLGWDWHEVEQQKDNVLETLAFIRADALAMQDRDTTLIDEINSAWEDGHTHPQTEVVDLDDADRVALAMADEEALAEEGIQSGYSFPAPTAEQAQLWLERWVGERGAPDPDPETHCVADRTYMICVCPKCADKMESVLSNAIGLGY